MTTSISLDDARRLAAEAQARADKATSGPWWIAEDGSVRAGQEGSSVDVGESDWKPVDLGFAIDARSDVPALAALVLALADEIERLRASLLESDARAQLREETIGRPHITGPMRGNWRP